MSDEGALQALTARVSSGGERLVFMSARSLTGYDNRDARSGVRDEEVFEYDGETGRMVCVSCEPSGARPVGEEYSGIKLNAGDLVWESGHVACGRWCRAGQNMRLITVALSAAVFVMKSGRVFFESRDALVPGDVNETWDVYEWEPVGVGSCSEAGTGYESSTGGCVSLVSSGRSAQESEFLDASASGGDVFFLTSAQLVPADYDSLLDVYDAHECSSAAPCLPSGSVSPPVCVTEASCKASAVPVPGVYGVPSSATFSGPGDLAPPPAAKKVVLTRAQQLARGVEGVSA